MHEGGTLISALQRSLPAIPLRADFQDARAEGERFLGLTLREAHTHTHRYIHILIS